MKKERIRALKNDDQLFEAVKSGPPAKELFDGGVLEPADLDDLTGFEAAQLVSELHAADALYCEDSPHFQSKYMSPISIRVNRQMLRRIALDAIEKLRAGRLDPCELRSYLDPVAWINAQPAPKPKSRWWKK